MSFRFILTYAVLFCILQVQGQTKKIYLNNEVSITTSLKKTVVSDSNDLIVSILYRNLSPNNQFVYTQFTDGGWYDIFGNIYVKIERIDGGKYRKYSHKTYDYFGVTDTTQGPEFHFEKLNPGKTIEASFHLFDKEISFLKGKYRVKVFIRKVPGTNSKNSAKPYLESPWIYFEAIKAISASINHT